MSLLFKKILGQNVVHPSRQPPSGPESADAQAPAGHQAAPSAEGKDTQRKANGKHASPPPAAANRRTTSTPAQTLLTRLKSCVVVQDMRDTLKELQNCDDLITSLSPDDLRQDIVPLLERFDEDEDVVNTTMKLLSRITADYGDEICAETLDERECRTIRAGFLTVLIPQIPLLVTQLKRTHVHFFWSRLYAVQILAHLEDQDPAATNKALLACHGLGVLVDVLSDTSKDGMLRNEALRLLATLTATDAEMQTILAFENGFDSLFTLIHTLGDVDSGAQGSVVIECLTIIHNLLRANKPAGKLFREMGSAQHLRPLLDVVTNRLRDAQQRKEQARRAGTAQGSASPSDAAANSSPSPGDKVGFDKLSSTQCTIILMAVSILGCLLRQAEPGTDAEETRRSAMDCGVLRPLTSVALSGHAVDDATRIESLRTVTLFLHGSKTKRVAQNVLDQPVLTLVGTETASQIFRWSSCRGLLEYLLCSEDKTMISAAAQLLSSLLENNSTSSGTLRVTEAVMDGFFEACRPNAATHDANTRCGLLLARALLGPNANHHNSQAVDGSSPSSTARYYAAHVVKALLHQPDSAAIVCQPVFHNAPTAEGTLGRLNPALYLTPAVPPNVLNALMCFYVLACAQNSHPRGAESSEVGLVDLPTLSALTQLLLAYLIEYAPGVMTVLGEPQWFALLLSEAQREDGPAHVRLWCAALLGQICRTAPVEPHKLPSQRGAAASHPVPSRAELLGRLRDALGDPGAFFDAILVDVRGSGSHYTQPTSDALVGNHRALYDVAFVETLEAIVAAMKELAPPSSAGAPSQIPPPPPRDPVKSASASLSSPPQTAAAEPPALAPPPPHSPPQAPPLPPPPVRVEEPSPQPPLSSGPSAAEFAALQQHHDAEMSATQQRHEAELTSMRVAHETALADIQEAARREAQAVNEHYAREKEVVAAEAAALQEQVHRLTRELEAKSEALADASADKDALDDQLRSWQQHAGRLEQAHQAALTELQHIREKLNEHDGSGAEAEALRRDLHLLNDTVANKDTEVDELRGLLASLEKQLGELHAHTQQVEAANAALRNSAPPPAVTSPDNAILEAQIAQLAQRDEEMRQYIERLELDMHTLRRDRDDLLLLVGEVDVECASLRANSASVTPSRAAPETMAAASYQPPPPPKHPLLQSPPRAHTALKPWFDSAPHPTQPPQPRPPSVEGGELEFEDGLEPVPAYSAAADVSPAPRDPAHPQPSQPLFPHADDAAGAFDGFARNAEPMFANHDPTDLSVAPFTSSHPFSRGASVHEAAPQPTEPVPSPVMFAAAPPHTVPTAEMTSVPPPLPQQPDADEPAAEPPLYFPTTDDSAYIAEDVQWSPAVNAVDPLVPHLAAPAAATVAPPPQRETTSLPHALLAEHHAANPFAHQLHQHEEPHVGDAPPADEDAFGWDQAPDAAPPAVATIPAPVAVHQEPAAAPPPPPLPPVAAHAPEPHSLNPFSAHESGFGGVAEQAGARTPSLPASYASSARVTNPFTGADHAPPVAPARATQAFPSAAAVADVDDDPFASIPAPEEDPFGAAQPAPPPLPPGTSAPHVSNPFARHQENDWMDLR